MSGGPALLLSRLVRANDERRCKVAIGEDSHLNRLGQAARELVKREGSCGIAGGGAGATSKRRWQLTQLVLPEVGVWGWRQSAIGRGQATSGWQAEAGGRRQTTSDMQLVAVSCQLSVVGCRLALGG